jgi:hypothetical protein
MTMAATLAISRDYLVQHRRMIVGRAIAASVVGVVPIPLLDDWLLAVVQRGAFRRIADAHHVELGADAVVNLVHGHEKPPEWSKMAGGSILYKIVARRWRRMILALVAAQRAKAAVRWFTVGTLFDHYCSRLHVGVGLGAAEALALRETMDKAIDRTPGGISLAVFRRAGIAAARATLRAPLELADIASGGAVRRLLKRRSEVEAAEEVDTALEKQMTSESSFLARATSAVELQLSAEGNPYLESLITTFDGLWRERAANRK